MSENEEIHILSQGVDAWNTWRSGQAPNSLFPNLRHASLRNASLSGINFTSTLLEHADLCGADLSRADFSGAVLENADLASSYLVGARFCDYHNVLVSRDNGLILQSPLAALFGGVNFEGTFLNRTTFIDLDLSKAKGLDKCIHLGPSSLDHQTLQKSKSIPLSFLRGCGISEALIEHLHSISGVTFQFYSCFISYSSADQEFAQKIHANLQDNGVRCWFAPKDLRIGERIRTGIDRAIQAHERLLLILSEASLGSQWVEQEVERALEIEREETRSVLFPIRLDEAVSREVAGWAAFLKNTRNIGDFTGWRSRAKYDASLSRLLLDLNVQPDGA